MNAATTRTKSPSISMMNLGSRIMTQRGSAFGIMIIGALLAFEIFNYSTTDFALSDVLGDLRFAGIRWSTILAVAFCGIDFAGIARLFTPEQGANEPAEVWYLFGAWLLAAAMNATLTWWGVSVAIASHQSLGSAVIDNATIQSVVPVFVAVMVWVIRILIIGTFSLAGERMFSQAAVRPRQVTAQAAAPLSRPTQTASSSSLHRPAVSNNYRPATARPQGYNRPETAYASQGSRQSAQVEYEPLE